MSAALLVTDVLATASGFWFSVAPLLQVRRIRKVGAATGVSAGMYATVLGNSVVWLAYGITRGLHALIWPNGVAIICASAALVTVWLYRDRQPGPAPAADVDEHQEVTEVTRTQ